MSGYFRKGAIQAFVRELVSYTGIPGIVVSILWAFFSAAALFIYEVGPIISALVGLFILGSILGIFALFNYISSKTKESSTTSNENRASLHITISLFGIFLVSAVLYVANSVSITNKDSVNTLSNKLSELNKQTKINTDKIIENLSFEEGFVYVFGNNAALELKQEMIPLRIMNPHSYAVHDLVMHIYQAKGGRDSTRPEYNDGRTLSWAFVSQHDFPITRYDGKTMRVNPDKYIVEINGRHRTFIQTLEFVECKDRLIQIIEVRDMNTKEFIWENDAECI